VLTETGLARIGLGLVALHVADDNWLQPNPGTSAGNHVLAGLVPLAALVAGIVLYPRLRAGAGALMSLAGGFLGVLFGTEAAYYTRAAGPSGDDYTGLLSIAGGLLLLGLGGVTLWHSRRRDDTIWWRYPRRLLLAGSAFVVVAVLVMPVTVAYVVTHAARADVPKAELGAAHENVEFRTSDGLLLKGWYIRSRNGAAVIASPGRSGTQARAKLLARHGYGVLLFDRRGEGESQGDPNTFGWHGARDIHAAVKYLQGRRNVDPQRIGGIGLSVGGEMMIQAAAESPALTAIVSEGASGRSVRDDLANPDSDWQAALGDGIATIATALFTDDRPPATLESLVPKIHGAVFFVYGERGQPAEKPANHSFYAKAHGPKALWQVPGSRHVGGVDARPREYERRVVAFFDHHLLQGKRTSTAHLATRRLRSHSHATSLTAAGAL
jgi:dienelactone hydrolase